LKTARADLAESVNTWQPPGNPYLGLDYGDLTPLREQYALETEKLKETPPFRRSDAEIT